MERKLKPGDLVRVIEVARSWQAGPWLEDIKLPMTDIGDDVVAFTRILSEKIALEIDREILNDLVGNVISEVELNKGKLGLVLKANYGAAKVLIGGEQYTYFLENLELV